MGFKVHSLLMWLLAKINVTTMVFQTMAAPVPCDELDACEADAVCGECWAIGTTFDQAYQDCTHAINEVPNTDCNWYTVNACCQHLMSDNDCLGSGLFLEAWYCTLDTTCVESYHYTTEEICSRLGVNEVLSGGSSSGAVESPVPAVAPGFVPAPVRTAAPAALPEEATTDLPVLPPVAAPPTNVLAVAPPPAATVTAPVATSPIAPVPVAAASMPVETREAGEVTTVKVSANAFDDRTDAVGCAPNGCTAENTRDGDLADVSRWSCSSELVVAGGDDAGEECQIVYEFSEAQVVRSVAVAFLKGDTRTRTVLVNVNGVLHTAVESGGITSDLEIFELLNAQGVLSIGLESTGLAVDEFLSIIEVEFQVSGVVTGPPITAPPTPAPAPPTSAPVVIIASPPTETPTAANTFGPITQISAPGPTATSTSARDLARDLGLTPSPTAEGAGTTAGSDTPPGDICLACINDEDCVECVTVGIESEAEHTECMAEAGDGVCDGVFAALCCAAALSGNDCMAMEKYANFVACTVQDSSECSIEDMECTDFLSDFGTDGNGAGATVAGSYLTATVVLALVMLAAGL